MEHMLLTPKNITMANEGIPYRLVYHLLEGTQEGGRCYHDANLLFHSGSGYDEDLIEINEMEKRLGNLSPRQMDLRVVADFCCIWRYDYPERVREICAAIGGSHQTAFRLHYQICPQRRQELIDYGSALKGWLLDKDPADKNFFSDSSKETVVKIYQFLGDKTSLKQLLVERTYLGLSKRYLNCSFWGSNASLPPVCLFPYTAQHLPKNWLERMSALEQVITAHMGQSSRDFLCEVGGAAEPACHFKFIRRIDILVSSIGCLRWRGNLPPKGPDITGRRHTTALYLNALEKYWRDRPPHNSKNTDKNIENQLFELLGEKTDFKRWLVASLWKNMMNQTNFHAYPMKRWVEFVKIGEDYIEKLAK